MRVARWLVFFFVLVAVFCLASGFVLYSAPAGRDSSELRTAAVSIQGLLLLGSGLFCLFAAGVLHALDKLTR